VDPATAVVVIVAILAGFGAGVGASGVAGQRAATKAIESNSAQLETVLDGQTALLELGARPVVIDAELRSTLAEVPVQCREDAGGDPAGGATRPGSPVNGRPVSSTVNPAPSAPNAARSATSSSRPTLARKSDAQARPGPRDLRRT
jgi:hypothetical protein